MIKTLIVACAVAMLTAAVPTITFAGNMRQSPALRKNQRRLCPNGKPMQQVRTGRSAIITCV